jgi:NADH:ubiquinone oxidoreductase subunit E
MNNDNKKIKVNLCLGSSCFSRGSKNTLLLLEEYIKSHDLEGIVDITGNLCKNKCKEGPNLSINGQLYGHMEPAAAIDILKHHIKQIG